MYLGVLMRQLEDLTEALRHMVNPSTVKSQQEDLRQNELGVTGASKARCLSLSDSMVEAHLGRRVSQCVSAGGQRGKFRRISGDFGHLRGSKETNSAGRVSRPLVDRGLKGVQLIMFDACAA